MKLECYNHWKQLPESADRLFEQAEKDNIFFSRSWFEGLSLGPDHTMVLACVVDGEKVMAVLPLMESAGTTWYSLKHGFTPIYNLLLVETEQEKTLSCLAQSLAQLPIRGLLLEPVADDDPNLIHLQSELEKAGFRCEYIFRHYNWVCRLEGKSYANYMAERPTQLINTINRKKRKLEREYGYDIRLFTGDEVLVNMSDYYAVYNASWKQNELENAGFIDSFMERFSQAGWSRLAILYVENQPIAAQIWFVCHGKANIFRLAYDKKWGRFSVGSILTSFLMKYVIDTDRVEEIDFLTGNDAYKQDWMSERRKRYLLSCIRNQKVPNRNDRLVGFMKNLLKRA